MDIRPSWFVNLFSPAQPSSSEASSSSEFSKKLTKASWLSQLLTGENEATPPVHKKAEPIQVANRSFEIMPVYDEEMSMLGYKIVELPSEQTVLTIHTTELKSPAELEALIFEHLEKETAVEACQDRPSLVAELEKTAGAFDLGDTEEQTIRKHYEAHVKAASDYALAEMLTEKRLAGKGIQENWHTAFPEALRKVKQKRKAAEKEAMDHKVLHSMVDRMKFLCDLMHADHTPSQDVDLYEPLFKMEGKQSWESLKNAWEDEEKSYQEKKDAQMPEDQGAGREADDHRGRQAPRSTTYPIRKKKVKRTKKANLEVSATSEKGLDAEEVFTQYKQNIVTQIAEEFHQPEEELQNLTYTVKSSWQDPAEDGIDLAFVYEYSVAAGPESYEVSLSGIQTPQTYTEEAGPQTSWDLDVDTIEVVRETSPQVASSLSTEARSQDTVGELPLDKYSVEYKKAEGGESYVKWFNTEKGAEQFQKQLKETEQGVQPKLKDHSKEFESANKTAVKKKADIPSPWQLIQDEDGSEVIARISPEELLKESEETKKNEKESHKIAKKASLSLAQLVSQIDAFLSRKIAAVGALELIALEPEPAPSLEGLEDHEKELWSKHYQTAISLAFANPMSRSLGESLTRRAAMVALLRAIRQFDPTHESKAKFSSYLYRAVDNELKTTFQQNKSLRQKSPEKFVDIDQPISEGDNLYERDTLADVIEDAEALAPEEELDKSQQIAAIKETVRLARERLSGTDKEVFELLAQGYNISEIAQMLGYSIPNVVRYRKKLANALGKILAEVSQKSLEGFEPEKEEPAYSPLPSGE